MNFRQTRRLLFDGVIMFLVAGFSLALLIYVAYGEAQRTYEKFYLEKMAAQGAVVQNAVEKHLQRGFPLQQYSGFSGIADRISRSDPTVVSLIATDLHGQSVFVSGDEGQLPLPSEYAIKPNASADYGMRRNDAVLQVILPLHDRSAQVGDLTVTMLRRTLSEKIQSQFAALPFPALLLSLTFAVGVCVILPRLKRDQGGWRQGAFAVTFLCMAVAVITFLVMLYVEGAQAKARALAFSLGYRLSDLVAFNVNFEEIRGLDRTLAEYRQVSPEISSAALTVNGVAKLHTDPKKVGRCWVSEEDSYKYLVDLTPPQSPTKIEVAVELPARTVFEQIVRCIKNFTALFIASAFVASVFLQVAESMHLPADGNGWRQQTRSPGSETELSLIKPVFFGAVFAEHLHFAFLPQYVETLATGGGVSSALVSLPFVAYWLSFALVLIPAGHLAEQTHPRPFIYGGFGLAALGLLLLQLTPDFWVFTFGRILSGIGQGVVFIGVQSYILLMAPSGKKTQGASIIVLGYQGGMIAGMAIGSLLVGSVGADGIFLIGTTIALGLTVYSATLLPAGTGIRQLRNINGRGLLKDFIQAIRQVGHDREFLAAMLLVGVPAKAILTGVVAFALPLLLSTRHLAQEDVGQIIMVYAGAVIAASGLVSRYVDRSGETAFILKLGTALSGLGLVVIGLFGFSGGSEPATAVVAVLPMPTAFAPSMMADPTQAAGLSIAMLLLGVGLLGAAHGFINAPVVTHIAQLSLSNRIGQGTATASYRFLERIGHVAGPIVVGQFLYASGNSPLSVVWIGVITILFAIGFAMVTARQNPQQLQGAVT